MCCPTDALTEPRVFYRFFFAIFSSPIELFPDLDSVSLLYCVDISPLF
ncbi:hypothetical protein, unlikely [Trypanosoma brucei brucei TREU927]|uniref:Uncharacterized protein n=1 Tax=Trypanosoma brucei brucei (strain 927/4 GUTat10.1) TaxID=185431 RepID=Q4GYD9_TRYB2|nr:hypothetical protein, unlikely [Trypanosoma brucei brucei TREU927]CAJ16645.1 hypothetical protein, unlikely [Trypanosoma brucei brucei TREU927]